MSLLLAGDDDIIEATGTTKTDQNSQRQVPTRRESFKGEKIGSMSEGFSRKEGLQRVTSYSRGRGRMKRKRKRK